MVHAVQPFDRLLERVLFGKMNHDSTIRAEESRRGNIRQQLCLLWVAKRRVDEHEVETGRLRRGPAFEIALGGRDNELPPLLLHKREVFPNNRGFSPVSLDEDRMARPARESFDGHRA